MKLDTPENHLSQDNISNTIAIKIMHDGTITCGQKRYTSENGTIRRDILTIMGQTSQGYLRRDDYQTKLIDNFFSTKLTGVRLITEPYIRRQNNVDKAISRLRHDLSRLFGEDFPPGTSWMCFSRKIDGWLLFRLPGLGCDGQYHW